MLGSALVIVAVLAYALLGMDGDEATDAGSVPQPAARQAVASTGSTDNPYRMPGSEAPTVTGQGPQAVTASPAASNPFARSRPAPGGQSNPAARRGYYDAAAAADVAAVASPVEDTAAGNTEDEEIPAEEEETFARTPTIHGNVGGDTKPESLVQVALPQASDAVPESAKVKEYCYANKPGGPACRCMIFAADQPNAYTVRDTCS